MLPRMQEVDELLHQLVNSDWRGRAKAATGLATHPGDAEDTAVTEAAMKALLAIGTAEATEALLDSLRDDDDETADHLYFFLAHAGSVGSSLAREVLQRSREA
jgi:hypothetical protein